MAVGYYFSYHLGAPVVAGSMVSYSSHKLGIVSLILSSITIKLELYRWLLVITSLTILVHQSEPVQW